MSDSSDVEFYDAKDEIGSPRADKSSESGDFTHVTKAEEIIDMVLTDDAFQSLPEQFETEQQADVVDSCTIEKSVELHDSGDVVVESVSVTELTISTETQPMPPAIVETVEMSGQKPDLLACVQDRPTDLPGVKPVDIVAVHVEEKTLPPPVPEPPASIKKVPPARPAPPRRPPPPKRGFLAVNKPKKPYLSEIDDGLLTPNSTVDNLTREFTEALNHDISVKQKDKESTTIKSEVTVTELPVKTSEHSDRNMPRKESASSINARTSPTNSMRRDEEILSGVIVKNLDTGESMPLSTAAEQVSHPLALQIMSRTKEFSYGGSSSGSMNSHDAQLNAASFVAQSAVVDSDSLSIASDDIDIGKDASKSKHHDGKKIKGKRKKLKKIVGKGMSKVKVVAGAQVGKAVQKVKHVKDEVTHNEQLNVSSDDEDSTDFGSSSAIKIKASSSNKGPYQFSRPKQVQDIAVHVGAVWCMKFSHCGRLLATAGQDNVIWVWVLKDFYNYFNDMRNKYDSKDEAMFGAASMKPMQTSEVDSNRSTQDDEVFMFDQQEQHHGGNDDEEDDAPFRQVPFSSYVGHAADVLDLAWSKNFFILSSSMDKTVRLWHISRKECLCCFQHIDFVTAIAFHPRDDRYFLSGSLDSKLRLWNIPDKKVALWNEVSPDGSSSSSGNDGGALITTVNFCENGKFAVCGTYDGRAIFFDTEHLKYHTQIHVRSSRGRNNKGHKITGIEPLQGEHKILVTSNDSRVRLYDLRDLSLVCKYKGHANLSSQIKASFSPDSKYIICGSEDKCVYVWRTSVPQDVTKLSSFRRDRNDSWESMKAHDAVVTCAVFAPQPQLLYKSEVGVTSETKRQSKSILSLSSKKQTSEEVNVIVSADFKGCIKVIVSAE